MRSTTHNSHEKTKVPPVDDHTNTFQRRINISHSVVQLETDSDSLISAGEAEAIETN